MQLSGQRIAPSAARRLSLNQVDCRVRDVGVGWHDGRVPDEGGDLRGPPPLVLISGDEPFLVDRAVQRTVASARRAQPEVERREAPAGGLTPGEFDDLVAPSLFAEPRVVVLRGAHEASKELAEVLLDYAASPVDGVVLVVHHGGGTRNKALADAMGAGGVVLTCMKITKPGERLDFVRAEIRRARGTTTPAAVAALVDAVGSDLRELAMASAQLVADTGGTVDEAAVRRYHRGRADVSGFTVSDATIAGDLSGALEALRWATSIGVAPVLIADALADGVRTIAKVSGARGGSSYALAADLGMPPWKIDRARAAVRGWSPAGVATGMAVVAELNAAVKGVAADADYALEKAVLDLVAARSRRP
jgi:DNA polymerase III subunit delta